MALRDTSLTAGPCVVLAHLLGAVLACPVAQSERTGAVNGGSDEDPGAGGAADADVRHRSEREARQLLVSVDVCEKEVDVVTKKESTKQPSRSTPTTRSHTTTLDFPTCECEYLRAFTEDAGCEYAVDTVVLVAVFLPFSCSSCAKK